MAKVFSAAKEVVDFYADAKLPEGPIGAAVAGENECERFGEMRGDLVNDAFFDAGLADETDAALGEVTDAAVKQAAGAGAGSECEIVLLDQTSAQSAHGSIAGNSGADDTAANDEDVELSLGQSLQRVVAARGWT